MNSSVHQVEEAARLLQFNYRLLDKAEAADLRLEVLKKYAPSYSEVDMIWRDLPGSAALYDQEGWQKIDGFLAGSSFFLFFDEDSDDSVIEFEPGTSLFFILGECPNFEYYVTNREMDYLICESDHDVLYAVGRAKEWLERLVEFKQKIDPSSKKTLTFATSQVL